VATRLRERVQSASRDARVARFSFGYLADIWGPPARAGRGKIVQAMASAAVKGALSPHGVPDVSHLALYEEEDASGPLQRDEALLLYGLVRVIRPKTVLEFGFLRGHSAFNFLLALDADAALYSFDVEPMAEQAARTIIERDQRLRFRLKSQDQITADDVDGRRIDFVFFDASHDLEINQRTFQRIEGLLAPRAVVAVHDTGAWARDRIQLSPMAITYTQENADHWLPSGDFAHRPDERRFVNWVGEARPDFGQIHLHSVHTLRHGLTLLQAGDALST
jgi:predicted O-methyltransferase YrrM